MLDFIFTSLKGKYCEPGRNSGKPNHHNTTTSIIRLFASVEVATLIFISGRGLAISFAKEGKSGFIYNLVKSQ